MQIWSNFKKLKKLVHAKIYPSEVFTLLLFMMPYSRFWSQGFLDGAFCQTSSLQFKACKFSPLQGESHFHSNRQGCSKNILSKSLKTPVREFIFLKLHSRNLQLCKTWCDNLKMFFKDFGCTLICWQLYRQPYSSWKFCYTSFEEQKLLWNGQVIPHYSVFWRLHTSLFCK